jgi:E3 ubiquitin-protein ligase UHRF1
MCGIMSGMENGGAMAICISGGYDDDADLGDVVTYTGEGGKDLSNNKRTTVGQQSDQAFVRVCFLNRICRILILFCRATSPCPCACIRWAKRARRTKAAMQRIIGERVSSVFCRSKFTQIIIISGLGIRVIRGYDKKAKQKKNKSPNHTANPVEPGEGYRYDGIYKITRYWSKQREDNNMVFQFELRRDDLEPAPWTDEGKKVQ